MHVKPISSFTSLPRQFLDFPICFPAFQFSISRPPIRRFFSLTILLGWALAYGPLFAAEASTEINPRTGLKSWRQTDRGITLEFNQLTPDAAQATYSTRDLSPVIYETMRDYCFFGSVMRNDTAGPISYRVADWRYVGANKKKARLRTKTEFVKEWRKKGGKFAWSILPDDMTLEVGDWALGYTPVKVAPGEHFDLIYVWSQQGKTYTGILQDMECYAPPPQS